MKVTNEFRKLVYVKGITCGPGCLGLVYFIQNIINFSLRGAIFSLLLSVLYFSDKDVRFLFKTSRLFIISFYFTIVPCLLVIYIEELNIVSFNMKNLILGFIIYCHIYILSRLSWSA